MNNIRRYIINERPVWQGRLHKINNQVVDNPPSFIIRPLNHKDVEAMGELSSEIYNHLGRGEECFIHKHDKQYYLETVNRPDLHYLGVFRGEKLIGMSYLRICRSLEEFTQEIPGCRQNFFTTAESKIAALGADSVLPAYRGNSLNRIMIAYRLELARHLQCQKAASIIDRSNHWNMPPYFKNGFQMFGSAIDPADGGKIALMSYNLQAPKSVPEQEQNQTASIQPKISVPFNRFDIIDKLFAKGFIGCGYNKQNGSITFTLKESNIITNAEVNRHWNLLSTRLRPVWEY